MWLLLLLLAAPPLLPPLATPVQHHPWEVERHLPARGGGHVMIVEYVVSDMMCRRGGDWGEEGWGEDALWLLCLCCLCQHALSASSIGGGAPLAYTCHKGREAHHGMTLRWQGVIAGKSVSTMVKKMVQRVLGGGGGAMWVVLPPSPFRIWIQGDALHQPASNGHILARAGRGRREGDVSILSTVACLTRSTKRGQPNNRKTGTRFAVTVWGLAFETRV